MTKSNPALIKKEAIPAPQTREEAADLITKIHKIQLFIAATKVEIEAAVTNIQDDGTKQIESATASLDGLFEALFMYAQANRNELTQDGKVKSADLGTGVVGWKFPPPSVDEISKDDLKSVLEYLRDSGMKEFIRVKEELDKEEILRNDDTKIRALSVPGISISQVEEFFCKPVGVKKEIKRTVSKTAIKIAKK